MLKKFILFLFLTPVIAGCSNDEAEPEVFMQVASIVNEGNSMSQRISYDSYGRVTSYKCLYADESVKADYEYVSDSLIRITTKHVIFGQNGATDIIRTFQDELHLNNGRAIACDGIFSTTEDGDTPFEKKYRHEFNYTSGNLLNTVKCTEWSKNGDKWAEDKPWTWENYYYWDNGNLVKIEDYQGNSSPFHTYTLKYTDITSVRNVVPIPMGRYQYIPLQAKGIFGSQPVNLISEIQNTSIINGTSSTSYEYKVADRKVTEYQESRGNQIFETFSIQWTK